MHDHHCHPCPVPDERHCGNYDHFAPLVSTIGIGPRGEKGEDGAPFTYDDFTEEQLADLRSDLKAFIKKSEASYTIATRGAQTITIPIDGFRSTDMLFVDVEGLSLVEGTDYTISGTNIMFANPIMHESTRVHFVALRAAAVTAEDYDSLKGDDGVSGDYDELADKPSINGVVIVGDKSFDDFGLNFIDNVEIDHITES